MTAFYDECVDTLTFLVVATSLVMVFPFLAGVIVFATIFMWQKIEEKVRQPFHMWSRSERPLERLIDAERKRTRLRSAPLR